MDNWESFVLHVSWGMAFSIAGEWTSGFVFLWCVEFRSLLGVSEWNLLLFLLSWSWSFITVLAQHWNQHGVSWHRVVVLGLQIF